MPNPFRSIIKAISDKSYEKHLKPNFKGGEVELAQHQPLSMETEQQVGETQTQHQVANDH